MTSKNVQNDGRKKVHCSCFFGMDSEKTWIFLDFSLEKNLDFGIIEFMIKREIEAKIRDKIGKGKAIIIYGPRQVGKTTLIREIFGKDETAVWYNGDQKTDRDLFSDDFSAEKAELLIGDHKTLIIDEAQRIPDIGIKLKIIQDNFGDKVQIVATGSSSFDLANKINEPLTGRKWVFRLYPLTTGELINKNGLGKEENSLEKRLIYGFYPDVVTDFSNAEDILKNLSNDNLYRDILNLGEIVKTNKLAKILQALAYQVGSQVSLNEIGNLVGLDSKTVDKYISLLEQSFVIFRVSSFSSNLRNELKSSNKFYFYDTGIRNAIINDFSMLEARSDVGALFENYAMAEIRKRYPDDIYFWRTTSGQEIDCVMRKDGKVVAIEFKYNENKTPFFSSVFTEKYRPAKTIGLNRKNCVEFYSGKDFNSIFD